MSESTVRIESLSAEELLLERLWNSLSATPASIPLTEPQRASWIDASMRWTTMG